MKDDLFDAGKMMRVLSRLEKKIDYLYRHLPCLAPDTEADCPFARARAEDELMDAGEDAHSALTDPVSVHAGLFSYRGPAIIGMALAALAVAGAFGYFLIFHRSPLH
jgi:hypothetical protein